NVVPSASPTARPSRYPRALSSDALDEDRFIFFGSRMGQAQQRVSSTPGAGLRWHWKTSHAERRRSTWPLPAQGRPNHRTLDSKKFETVVADKQLRNQNSQAATSWGFRSPIRFARTFREIRAVTGPADPDVPETAAAARSPTKLRRLLRTSL